MQRFADVIHGRRRDLGLSLAAIAAADGPSEPTMVRIESGQSPPLRNPTLAKLDTALRWPQGSALNVYKGGDPLPTPDGPAPASGEIGVAVATVTDLVEAITDLGGYARDHPQDDGDLTRIVDRLRFIISPLVGRVVADMLRADRQRGVSPDRVAAAIEDFLGTPAADVTPARTAANTELRRLADQAVHHDGEGGRDRASS